MPSEAFESDRTPSPSGSLVWISSIYVVLSLIPSIDTKYLAAYGRLDIFVSTQSDTAAGNG